MPDSQNGDKHQKR